jgi:hypothetical protein
MNRVSADERQIGQALVSASDAALARVVALVDALPKREMVDRVLDRARPRLRKLRPPRPLSAVRLLFLPLDGVIVLPAGWRRGSGEVPRSALAPIAGALALAAPGPMAAIAAEAAGRNFDEMAAVGALGIRLWALGAQALPARPPAGWEAATGLRSEDYAGLAQLCIGVWQHAEALWGALAAAEEGPPEAVVRAGLAGLATAEEPVFAAALATLLARAAKPGAVASIAASMVPRARHVAGRALDRVIDNALPTLDPEDPHGTLQRMDQVADLLEELETSSLGGAPERRERLQKLRHGADKACRAAFAAGIESQLVEPARRMSAAADDRDVAALEDSARLLKALETAGRRLGPGDSYERAQRATAIALSALQSSLSPTGLQRMDLARVAEIMCGREAAVRILGRAPAG